MEIIRNLNAFVIPPFISLAVAITIAVISIVKGKLGLENILFALVCVMWSLLAPIFILHHLFWGDIGLIMKIERSFHFFYVYLPAVTMLFYYKVLGAGNRYVVAVLFIISLIFSIFTQTAYYLQGLYTYSWGYMAKGGPAFHLFGIYGTAVVIYFIVYFIRQSRTEQNPIMLLKMRYLLLSFNLIGLLTITNIPAMNGINFYPLGNFMFVPMIFMGYGIVSYRLMEIRTALHRTLMWIVMSSLILIPNYFLFHFIYPLVEWMDGWIIFTIAVLWFASNYFYITRVQPLIDQVFNRRKYDLVGVESMFIENISSLKTLNSLISVFSNLVRKTLFFESAEIALCHPDAIKAYGRAIRSHIPRPEVSAWLIRSNHLIDRAMVESNPVYAEMRDALIALFDEFDATFLVPIVQQGELLALLALPEKQNLRPLTTYEVKFINHVRSAAAISLENSIMFSNLSMMKERLEDMVETRTAELSKARDTLLNDLEMARRIQSALLPKRIPQIKNVEISYQYVPVLGVGGDFIDVYLDYRGGAGSEEPEAVCFFICDVSGHGVAAALTASMVKMSLASWDDYARSPSLHLNYISRSLEGKTGGNFITAIVGYLEMKTGRVVFANAGHPPLILMKSDGDTDVIGSHGRMMCDIGRPDCEDKEIYLEPDDMIVLYTDGIIEVRRESELFGEERFIDILRRNYRNSINSLCNAVIDSLVAFKGSDEMDDDLTLMGIRYKNPGRRK